MSFIFFIVGKENVDLVHHLFIEDDKTTQSGLIDSPLGAGLSKGIVEGIH